jgi:hypothetical protein
MVYYVPLEKLPPDLHIPEQLQDRFWYDADRKCLAFDGVMYKLTFDRIQALSTCFDYQRAVEELFRLAVPGDTEEHGSHLLAVASGVVLAVVLFGAGLFVWQQMQTDSGPSPAQPSITNDLADN